MSFDVPDDRQYLETHEWARPDDGTIRVGITEFAQDELGDVVFVELPDEGDHFDQRESFGVVESIKAVSDLYAPVSGTVRATNDELLDRPELINDDPFEDGWMLELDPDDQSQLETDPLLSATAYREQTE